MISASKQEKELASNDGNEMPLAWESRVFLVALVGLIPGIQLGCIVAVILATTGAAFYGTAALGGILGMIAGGKLEADHWF
jgi:hypothetical protein